MGYRLLLIFLVWPLFLQAQFAETIRTGRPGAAIGPFTVGSKVFQLQTGVNLGRKSLETDHIHNSHAALVVRYGILERVEVSGVAVYSDVGWGSLEGPRADQRGLSAAQLGFRVNIIDSKGSGPSLGFQSRLKLNVLDDDFEQEKLATASLLILSQKLGAKVGLTANLGLVTSGNEGDDPNGVYVLNFSMPVGSKISVFIENYGTISDEFETHFDGGLGYLINNDLQLDASLGYGKNHGIADAFVDFGLSWRLIGNR